MWLCVTVNFYFQPSAKGVSDLIYLFDIMQVSKYSFYRMKYIPGKRIISLLGRPLPQSRVFANFSTKYRLPAEKHFYLAYAAFSKQFFVISPDNGPAHNQSQCKGLFWLAAI